MFRAFGGPYSGPQNKGDCILGSTLGSSELRRELAYTSGAVRGNLVASCSIARFPRTCFERLLYKVGIGVKIW